MRGTPAWSKATLSTPALPKNPGMVTIVALVRLAAAASAPARPSQGIVHGGGVARKGSAKGSPSEIPRNHLCSNSRIGEGEFESPR